MFVEIKFSVKGEAVREFSRTEPQNVAGFVIDRAVYLRKNVRDTPRHFYVWGIEVGFHDAVGAGEGTSFDKVDCFVSAAYMVFRARTIPHDAALRLNELYLW
jgi:hypothetical protein